MNYAKLPLTYEQQADLLLARGMVADRGQLIDHLRSVNYYRLTAYWYPFKRPDSSFEPGTSLDVVWNRYTFDRQLRLLVMDAIERVEVAVRSRLVYELVHRYGPFAHLDPAAWPGVLPAERQRFIDDVHDAAQRSREAFIDHFRRNYDEFPDLPLWVVAEIMTFGNMLTLFRRVGMHAQRTIANQFNLAGRVLESWLLSLNYVRNLCAHHSRLWNRELAIKPQIPDPRHHPEWHQPAPIANDFVFAVLSLLRHLTSVIAPQSGWRDRLFDLFDRYPAIPIAHMGIPEDWRGRDLWR